MSLVLVLLLPVLLFSVVVLCLPDIRKKDDKVKIGTLFGKEYDMVQHRFLVRSEYRKGLRRRGNWFVCIYVYEKANPGAALCTHLLSVFGGKASTERKAERIEELLNQ